LGHEGGDAIFDLRFDGIHGRWGEREPVRSLSRGTADEVLFYSIRTICSRLIGRRLLTPALPRANPLSVAAMFPRRPSVAQGQRSVPRSPPPMPTELTVKRVPIDSVHPDPANVRLHDERNLEAIKSSLARFGQQKPIVVDRQGVVRAGNGTHAAAKAL